MKAKKDDIDKTSRLKEQAAFDSLRKTKKRWVSKGFALQACDNNKNTIGFCVITSKKAAKSAVVRNRMRRRLRSVALEILPQHACPDMDYMVVARKDADSLDFDVLKRDMIWCLKRLDLLAERHEP